MGVQSSGDIVFVIDGNFGPTGFLIGRVTANGALDTAFGTGGFTTIDFDGFNDHARDLVVLPDDKVLVGGSALPPGKVLDSRRRGRRREPHEKRRGSGDSHERVREAA